MAGSRGYVLFMVEGQTDEMALGRVLSKLIAERDGNETRFDVMRTDILAKYRFTSVPSGGSGPIDPREKVREEILAYIERQRIAWKDITQIVYLTDTDGVFVPDDAVLLDESCEHVQYGASEMRCACPDRIRARNHQKSESLLELCRISELTFKRHPVPFSVHYFSRNLEHALHGRIEEQTQNEKVKLARAFSARYSQDVLSFRQLLDGLCPVGGYQETWEYIARGTRSLERGSNLILVL